MSLGIYPFIGYTNKLKARIFTSKMHDTKLNPQDLYKNLKVIYEFEFESIGAYQQMLLLGVVMGVR